VQQVQQLPVGFAFALPHFDFTARPVFLQLWYGMGIAAQVYNVTSGKSLPQWLSETKKRALRKDDEYTRRLELLQDFGFPSSCQRIKITPDQQYIFATGYHPPMVRHAAAHGTCTDGPTCKKPVR
jgi:hypothetical protein